MTTKKGPTDVGTRKYLLFDDALTQDKKGFALTMNPGLRADGPVLLPDRPWEVAGIVGDSNVTVMEDGGIYKLWYVVNAPLPPPDRRKGRQSKLSLTHTKDMDRKTLLDYLSHALYMLCYATSTDGVHWEKPNLGVYKYRGSNKNNIVMTARLGCTVFKDPTARADKRYKMIYGGGRRMTHVRLGSDIPPKPVYHAIYGAYSADGIHWKSYTKPIIPWYTDTTNVCYWDDRISKYVAFMRWNENMTYDDGRTLLGPEGWQYRAIGRSESNDFRSFPRPTKILEPGQKELSPAGKRLELYNSSAIKYPFAADSYFLFPSYFYLKPDTLDVHLATSRDGVNYIRWRDPFIGLGRAGSFDSKCIYMATGMIRRGNEINMYYRGSHCVHGTRQRPRRCGGIGRVRIRLDGFVSQDAGWSGGSLVTVPLRPDGSHLGVNMDANAGGRLKVALLDRAMRPIPGYSSHDADWLWGNDLHKTVTWSGQAEVSRLTGRTVRLNFIGRGVKLYAFQFTRGGKV